MTHPVPWHKVSEQGYLGLFFYRARKMGSFEVLLVIFSTFSSQNLKYPTLMHWLESWVNPTSKTDIPCLPTTSQVPPVQFSWDSVALNFRPIWCHGPSLKHCVGVHYPNWICRKQRDLPCTHPSINLSPCVHLCGLGLPSPRPLATAVISIQAQGGGFGESRIESHLKFLAIT